MRPIGVLLAGGQAKRMGGGDKPLQLLGGRPLLTHIVDRLTPQVERLVLNVNGDPARFAAWELPVVPDNADDNPGPMAGILAGLAWAGRAGATDIFSTPTDTPFLPKDTVDRLLAARERDNADIAVVASGAHTHFATALWPVSAGEALRGMMADGVRRIEDFQKAYRVAIVRYDVSAGDPFLNINTLEDLSHAEQRFGDSR